MDNGTWPSRADGLALLEEYTSNRNLIKHGLALEAALRAYAGVWEENADQWGLAGLIHDFDYERYPDKAEHAFKGAAIIRERGWPEELAETVLAHAEHTGAARDSRLKQALYASDDLTGLIVAVALVRPSRKIEDVTVEAVMKKWKEKGFASGADREAIEAGAAELGLPLEEHIGIVLKAMQNIASELGL